MGLAEKRKAKELQAEVFPERTKELSEIIGSDITYEVDWDSFETFDELNFLDNVSCHRINMAFRMICTDAVGKEAAQEGLKTIKLKNVKSSADKKMDFSGGVLSFECAYAEKMEGAFSDGEIRKLVEENL